MGPVVVVPVPHGPTPSAPSPLGPGRPAVTPPAVAPDPSRTCSGGRPVPLPPPPASDDGKDGSWTGAHPAGQGGSHVTGDEKASRPPRGEWDDDRDAGGDEDESASHGGRDEGDEGASHGGRGDADGEWDD
ncbi:hypothetical protein [Streptomyces californicus]|uniref:hypothetical protein n=1 Tax=Streptomyces californicus TaxID=67351 RepID=UPI0036CA53AC